MRRRLNPVLALTLVALGMLGGAGCRSSREAPRKFSGTLETTEYNVGPKTPGRLTAVLAQEGDKVRRGQLLATLDRHDQAQRDYERALGLYKQGGASEQAVEHSRLAREDQEIFSPVDGIVLLKIHETGAVVAAGMPVFVIGDAANRWVRVYVPEGLINRVRLGQTAAIRLDGLSESFPGKVAFIAPKAEFTPRNVQTPEERILQVFAVKVALDNPPEYLRPGIAADVLLGN